MSDDPAKKKYPNASHKRSVSKNSRGERKIEKVVQGPVKIRQKKARARSEFETVLLYLVTDIIAPAAKNILAEVADNLIQTVLWGESRPMNRRNLRHIGASALYTAYDDISQGNHGRGRHMRDSILAPPRRSDAAIRDIFYPQRRDAEGVLQTLLQSIALYGSVTVADLYDATGLSGQFTDYDYGWVNLSSARILQSRGEWYIDLPSPIRLQ